MCGGRIGLLRRHFGCGCLRTSADLPGAGTSEQEADKKKGKEQGLGCHPSHVALPERDVKADVLPFLHLEFSMAGRPLRALRARWNPDSSSLPEALLSLGLAARKEDATAVVRVYREIITHSGHARALHGMRASPGEARHVALHSSFADELQQAVANVTLYAALGFVAKLGGACEDVCLLVQYACAQPQVWTPR